MDNQNPISPISSRLELRPEQAQVAVDPGPFQFDTISEVEALQDGVVGQPRAVAAMEFGLSVRHRNYHLYLSGIRGTGKTTFAVQKTQEFALKLPTPADWCYLFNFDLPEEPIALSLPAGLGHQWAADMVSLVKDLESKLQVAFDSVFYEQRRRTIIEGAEHAVDEIWGKMATMAQLQGFLLQRTPAQVVTIPLERNGQPMNPATFAALSEIERNEWRLRERKLEEPIAAGMRQIRQQERQLGEELKRLDFETGKQVLDEILGPIVQKYQEVSGVVEHLKRIQADVLDHLDYFRGPAETPAGPRQIPRDFFLRYRVNLLADHHATQGAPVVVETNPTYSNLFGKFEYHGEYGMATTNFTLIKPGALHRACGGYLILQVKDLLQAPFAYDTLKRTLLNGEVRIENITTQLGGMVPVSMRPNPIPVDVKVILVGSPDIFQLLSRLDEDFRRLFKIQVPFDAVMDNAPENVANFVRLLADYVRKEAIRPLSGEAARRLAGYSHRLAEDQDKLSTRFGEILAVAVEADAWAAQASKAKVEMEDVDRAIREKTYRSNMLEERLQEMMADGTLMIRTDGRAVGEVNGLAVLQIGDYAFGKPNRITARTFLSNRGIVHIERENKMSGRIHSKGVLVLTGFVQARFAQTIPLRFGASLTFEQMYDEVDGDSASSTELYALLSELAGLPIQQGIAVTGSVNQNGEVQPIGGVNEKIEGYFRLCAQEGLTGNQGVMIPASNVKNLMLDETVIEAMVAGKFHLWAVSTIDEGIAVLTGVEAGTADADGHYPDGSVNGRVVRRLTEYAEQWKGAESDS